MERDVNAERLYIGNKRAIYFDQFAENVCSFSSQYGGRNSILYSVNNITGKPSTFPKYGDYPQTYTTRTYGPWWDEAPSAAKSFMVQSRDGISSKDYVDVSFERCVVPTTVIIYETYNPGTVVRIWAGDETDRQNVIWHLLWSGPPKLGRSSATKFSPSINFINVSLKLLRIEFDHSVCDYFPGIDAVMLGGIPVAVQSESLQSELLHSAVHTIPPSINIRENFIEFLHNKVGYTKYLLAGEGQSEVQQDVVPGRSCLDHLPVEIVTKILGYCDLRSICRLAQTNRALNALTHDALLFSELNLKDYWWCYRDAMAWAVPRCTRLRKLDVSWVYNTDPWPFLQLLASCSPTLTHLRVNCSRFLSSDTVKVIFSDCRLLEELTMHHGMIPKIGIDTHQMYHLQRLNLYHSNVDFRSLINLLKQNPELRHLNLGSCGRLLLLDDLMAVLSKHNKRLITLDLWKTGQMGAAGLQCFSTLTELEEIDIGWCVQVLEPANHFETIARSCTKLRKVFLGACRALTDRDLTAFLRHCPHLEQVDLMGILTITSEAVAQLLCTCHCLRYLDISYCHLITHQVKDWRKTFPHVAIKQSSSLAINFGTGE